MKVYLIEEKEVNELMQDLLCRVELNRSRFHEDGLTHNIVDNLNICFGMFKAMEKLGIVDPVFEKNFKEFTNFVV